MKNKRILIVAMAMLTLGAVAQESRTLTLAEVVEMAQTESPDAVAARNTYKAAYWTYRNYRANNLPELSLGSNPYLNRTTDYVTSADGSVKGK